MVDRNKSVCVQSLLCLCGLIVGYMIDLRNREESTCELQ